MRKILIALSLVIPSLLLPGCSAVSTFDKYATLRFYEFNRTDIKYSHFDGESGMLSSNPNFRNTMLPARIADNNQWIDFTDDMGQVYKTFGNTLHRDTFPAGLEPIKEFVAWSQLPPMQRLIMRDTLNAKPEFTSINARLVLERGTNEPLLVFTGSSLPWETAPQYAIDKVNAVRMLVNARIWYEILK
ncbi:MULTISPECIES: hypothetical protein [Pseudomonas]|uniref:Lipoprotein n=1 Tax=Pseudomonas extremaustralis TaxID=359110 RepID=A0A5M9IVE5_9PSED|nr:MULTISPECIES: hypothetical protein [Pseudomonas]KAA8559475.1 hypothetical protein FX985_05853 [Pseudomonas extremaustralis]WLD65454.1 hypothetical protein QU606_24285 [Pseudomonas sp. OVF7]